MKQQIKILNSVFNQTKKLMNYNLSLFDSDDKIDFDLKTLNPDFSDFYKSTDSIETLIKTVVEQLDDDDFDTVLSGRFNEFRTLVENQYILNFGFGWNDGTNDILTQNYIDDVLIPKYTAEIEKMYNKIIKTFN